MKTKFLTLFLAGFVAGVIYLAVFGRTAVHDTSLLSSYFFSKYQYLEFASEELFLYCLKSRLSTFWLLWLAGFTVMGAILVHAYLFWLGASLGITVTTAAMKLGIQGILICIVSGLPHFLLYVPAGCWLLRRICRMTGSKKLLRSYLLVMIAGVILIFLGAFLESYVNPLFLKVFLKKV